MRGDGRGRGWSGRDSGSQHQAPGGHPGGGLHPRLEGTGHHNGLRARTEVDPSRSNTFSGGAQRSEPLASSGDRATGFPRDDPRSHENPRKRTFSGQLSASLAYQ